MNEQELKQRTKQFGLRVIKLVESLPGTTTARTIGNQLLRSGMSVGANYRAACRGRSKAERQRFAAQWLGRKNSLILQFSAFVSSRIRELERIEV